MFIKFEKPNKDIYINKDHIVSMTSESHGVYWAIKFNLIDNNTEYPSYFMVFETKAQAEKALDAMFSKMYQDNTLIVFGKESGLVE